MPVFSYTMPTLTGVPDAAWLLGAAVLVAVAVPVAALDAALVEEVDDELQAAAASAIIATPVSPASPVRLGLVAVPPMSPP
jgi:hypothetical protein